MIPWLSSCDRQMPPPKSSPEIEAASPEQLSLSIDEKRQAHGVSPARSFHGDPCTEDCSGHQAGYDWAEQKDIDDEDDCDTPSESFNEGCKSYVEETNGEDRDGEDSE